VPDSVDAEVDATNCFYLTGRDPRIACCVLELCIYTTQIIYRSDKLTINQKVYRKVTNSNTWKP